MTPLHITCNNSGMIRDYFTDTPYMVFEISLPRGKFSLLTNKKQGLVDALTKASGATYSCHELRTPADVIKTMEDICDYLGCGVLVDEEKRVVAYNLGNDESTADSNGFHTTLDGTDVYLNVYDFGSDATSIEIRETRGGGVLPEDLNTHLEVLVDFLNDESDHQVGMGSPGLRQLFNSLPEVMDTSSGSTAMEVGRESSDQADKTTLSTEVENNNEVPRYYLENMILVDRLTGTRYKPTVGDVPGETGYHVTVDIENIGEVKAFIPMVNIVKTIEGK